MCNYSLFVLHCKKSGPGSGPVTGDPPVNGAPLFLRETGPETGPVSRNRGVYVKEIDVSLPQVGLTSHERTRRHTTSYRSLQQTSESHPHGAIYAPAYIPYITYTIAVHIFQYVSG